MESLNELKRSSVQKKVRAEARRAAFEAQVKSRHGEVVFRNQLELHDKAIRVQYGASLNLGWLPNEINAAFCVDEVKVALDASFDADLYVIAWESLFGPVPKYDESILLNKRRRRINFSPEVEIAAPDSSELGSATSEKQAMQAVLVRSGAAEVQQTWYPTGEDETTPGRADEDRYEELLDAIPEEKLSPADDGVADYDAQLRALQEQLSQDGVDTNKVLAKILILKELKGKSAGAADSVGAPKKLPTNLYQSYDKQDAKISISDHIELLDDFLTNQPAKRHVDFLYLSLKGTTLKKFRKYYAKYKKKMTYKRAVSWLLLECTHKAERVAVSKQLRTVKQGPNENFEAFYTRAEDLRERLGKMGASEDNFHMRAYIEDGMNAKIMERIRFEVNHESWEYDEFIRRATTYDRAINHAANVPQFLNAAIADTQADSPDSTTQLNAVDVSADDKALQSKIAKRANQQVAKLMAAQGFTKKKGKWVKGKVNDGKKNKRPREGGNEERVDRTEETAVPGWAKWTQMKQHYPADLWAEREQHVESGKPASEAKKLYQRDRWNKRFVCWACRTTGHTQDRCPKE